MSKEFIVETSTPERLFVKVYHDFLKSKLLSGKEQIVFIHLKRYINIGNDNGVVDDIVYPTLATLAENLKMNEKTIREILKKLQKVGVLEIKRQGLNKPNIYKIKDSVEIWEEKSREDNQSTTDNFEVQKKIKELEALGYVVTKPHSNSKPRNKARKTKTKNSFNNFKQNEYNVEAIEKQILSN